LKEYRRKSVLIKTKKRCKKTADAAIMVRRVRTHARRYTRTHTHKRAHTCSMHPLKPLLPVARRVHDFIGMLLRNNIQDAADSKPHIHARAHTVANSPE
jgi:hypothetical protein